VSSTVMTARLISFRGAVAFQPQTHVHRARNNDACALMAR